MTPLKLPTIKDITNELFDGTVLPELISDQQILFQDVQKQIRFWLFPQDTDDANDGTPVALNNTPAYQFADAATKVAYFSFIWPYGLRLAKSEFVWSTPATSGNLRYQIDIGAGGDSDATNASTTGGTAATRAADGTANEMDYVDFTSLGGVNWATIAKEPGDLIGIKFTRTGADAGDTLTNTVNLYGIILTFI